ncbi:response regulator [Clostridium swellfunianum]|uniref:response regulator transcription factor n=1 Tax=Clostridium swellfunianum TaxID=1367462 RepID=UPI00202F4E01|nr:response regulator [Clostridium swellfunianum]MCM0649502.1 response regulator [Clostridium swellfunianum]
MIKVLIVDDEYFAREGMKKTIPWEDYGCVVCGEAKDGFEGVEEAKRLKPDIIVTDISMPQMNGIEMAKEIRKLLPECKFIIITGFDEFEYAKAAIKLSAIDFILKPIDESEFLEALKIAAERCRKSIKNNILIKREEVIRISQILKEEKELLLTIQAYDKVKMEKLLRKIYFNILNKENYDIIKQVSIDIVLKSLNTLSEYNISVEDARLESLDVYERAAETSNLNEAYNWVYKVLLNIIEAVKEAALEANDTSIYKAIDFIKEHFCEDISLSDVAKEVYLSESYLSRKLKKVKGISFVEYITRLRMKKAMELLKDPSIKINDIAKRVGYPDYRYFSQTFKKYYGYSPSEFIKTKS